MLDVEISTAEELYAIIDILSNDENVEYVQPMRENNITIDELRSLIVRYQASLGMFINHKVEPLVGLGTEDDRGYPSTAFNYRGGTSENINVNTGSLIYEKTLSHCRGRGTFHGFGFDLAIKK